MKRLICLVFLICSVASADPDGPRWYYLGPHVEVNDPEDLGTYLGLPAGTVGSVDLSSATKGNVVFVSSDVPFSGSPEYVGGFTSLQTVLTPTQLNAWKNKTGAVPVGSGHTLLDVLWLSLTEWDAPFSPIVPTSRGTLELHLSGHSRIRSASWAGEMDAGWARIRKLMRANYRKVRAHALVEVSIVNGITLAELQAGTSETPEEIPYILAARRLIQTQGLTRQQAKDRILDYIAKTHRRYLADKARKLKCRWEELIPPDLPQESPVNPETTYSDNFNDGDLTGWTTVQGSWSNPSTYAESAISTGFPSIRYASNLSSDDHYSQVDFTYRSASAGYLGPVCRFDTASQTYYYCLSRTTGGLRVIGKYVSASATTLWSDALGGGPTRTLYLESDGSTITFNDAGSLAQQITDTAISGYIQCGIFASASQTTRGDNWIAEDLPVPEPPAQAGFRVDIFQSHIFQGSVIR